MARKWSEDFVDRVICGDCLEVMKEIPNGSIDLVVTDPPFAVRSDDWDFFRSDFDFKYFTGCWLRECYRIAPVVITFFADKYISLLRTVAEELSVPYRRALVWQKPPGSQFAGASKDGYWYDFEIIQVFGQPKENNRKATKFGVLDYRTIIGQNHGCEKPIELLENLIESYSQEGQVILDPFLGSGTTAVAAKQLGRHFIGIEISPDYVKIAEERLKQEVLDLKTGQG